MNTANRFKVGDLVAFTMSKAEMPRPKFFPVNPKDFSSLEPIVTSWTVARRVKKVKNGLVCVQVDNRLEWIPESSIRMV